MSLPRLALDKKVSRSGQWGLLYMTDVEDRPLEEVADARAPNGSVKR